MDSKLPETDQDREAIDIFLFSNGQGYSPPRKYHLLMEELHWWKNTLSYLGRAHYGSMHTAIELYTIDGRRIESPTELMNGSAYVAVVPPESFVQSGYDLYLIKASRSWEKRQKQKTNNLDLIVPGLLQHFTKSTNLSPEVQNFLVNPVSALQNNPLNTIVTNKVENESSDIAANVRNINDVHKHPKPLDKRSANKSMNQRSYNKVITGKINTNLTSNELNTRKTSLNRRGTPRANIGLNKSSIPGKIRGSENNMQTEHKVSNAYAHIGPKVEDRNFRQSSIPKPIKVPVGSRLPTAPPSTQANLENVHSLSQISFVKSSNNDIITTNFEEPTNEAIAAALGLFFNDTIINMASTKVENKISNNTTPTKDNDFPIKSPYPENSTQNDNGNPILQKNENATNQSSNTASENAHQFADHTVTSDKNKDTTTTDNNNLNLPMNVSVETANMLIQTVNKYKETDERLSQVSNFAGDRVISQLSNQSKNTVSNLISSLENKSSVEMNLTNHATRKTEDLNNKAAGENEENQPLLLSAVQPSPALQNTLGIEPDNQNNQYIAVITEGGVVNLKLDIEVRNIDGILKTNHKISTRKSRSCTELRIEGGEDNDGKLSRSKSLQSSVSEPSGPPPHLCCQKNQQMVVVQCACCDSCTKEGGNQIVNTEPPCKGTQPCYVLVPLMQRTNTDCCSQICSCTSEKQVQNTVSLIYSKESAAGPQTDTTDKQITENASEISKKTIKCYPRHDCGIPKYCSPKQQHRNVVPCINQEDKIVQKSQDNGISISTSFKLHNNIQDNFTQTDWCNVLLEARAHPNGCYTFHLPQLDTLKHYGI